MYRLTTTGYRIISVKTLNRIRISVKILSWTWIMGNTVKLKCRTLEMGVWDALSTNLTR